ncbi:MAG: integrase core domain-containing protein [Terriglobia bacterium]
MTYSNPYVERLIGSTRRECLDHIIVLNEASQHRILKSYFHYYQRFRTHLSLDKDAPRSRRVEPAQLGHVVGMPEVGGLHHRYKGQAA